MKPRIIAYSPFLILTACGNPGGLSDADYNKYQELGPPKLLFTCTHKGRMTTQDLYTIQRCMENVADGNATTEDHEAAGNCLKDVKSEYKNRVIVNAGYSAGVGMGSTYNKLLMDAKDNCDGEFEVLKSTK